jgi:hypothetical protein
MNRLLIAMLGMALAGAASAKLPQLSPEAQAKAEETKQKTAWSDKVAAYQLCKAQDRVAADYRQKKGSQPVAATAPAAVPSPPAVASAAPSPAPAVPSCQDPGPYVAAADAAKVGVADSLPVPAAGKPPTQAEGKK